MTDATVVAAITAIPATLASLVAAWIAYFGWKKGQDNGKKSDVIIHKAEEIHTLTNSNLTDANEHIEALEKVVIEANRRVSTLEKIITDMATSIKNRG